MQRLMEEREYNPKTNCTNIVTAGISCCTYRLPFYSFLLLALPIVLIIIITTVSTNTNDCYSATEKLTYTHPSPPNQTSLELVFLIDRSSQAVLREMPRLIYLTEDVSKVFPNGKFGVNLYSDFLCTDWHGPDNSHCKFGTWNVDGGYPPHTDPEGCYTLYRGLSTDIPRLRKSVEPGAIQFYPSGWYESGVAAIMMTAADKKVGWTANSKKVIVVITDCGTHDSPKKYGGQEPPKGDGTDTCETMQNPTANFTGELLRKQDISLFLLLSTPGNSDANPFEHWASVVGKMDVKYGLATMSNPNSLILRQLERFLI